MQGNPHGKEDEAPGESDPCCSGSRVLAPFSRPGELFHFGSTAYRLFRPASPTAMDKAEAAVSSFFNINPS